ncbi:MAG: hypothetical protein KDJ65_36355 [Anaerolineae bacterium]|nr:hypothetical protein [Anaerolineae bacterium]
MIVVSMVIFADEQQEELKAEKRKIEQLILPNLKEQIKKHKQKLDEIEAKLKNED